MTSLWQEIRHCLNPSERSRSASRHSGSRYHDGHTPRRTGSSSGRSEDLPRRRYSQRSSGSGHRNRRDDYNEDPSLYRSSLPSGHRRRRDTDPTHSSSVPMYGRPLTPPSRRRTFPPPTPTQPSRDRASYPNPNRRNRRDRERDYPPDLSPLDTSFVPRTDDIPDPIVESPTSSAPHAGVALSANSGATEYTVPDPKFPRLDENFYREVLTQAERDLARATTMHDLKRAYPLDIFPFVPGMLSGYDFEIDMELIEQTGHLCLKRNRTTSQDCTLDRNRDIKTG
jgi:hypothetical protein